MPWYTVSGALILAGGTLMYTASSTTSTLAICGGIQGWYSVASAKVKASDMLAAIGFINCVQIGTGVITLSIAGSVF
jgi:hypothetical protein